MFTQYFLYKNVLLFIRQYDHLENYVTKELILQFSAKHQTKNLKTDTATELDVWKNVLIITFVLYRFFVIDWTWFRRSWNRCYKWSNSTDMWWTTYIWK